MLSWILNRRSSRNECIEEVFFSTILVIAAVGSCIAMVLELVITPNFNANIWLGLLLIQTLLLGIFSIRKYKLEYLAVPILGSLALILSYRGLMMPKYHHITCTLLITAGFISSLITRGMSRHFLRTVVLIGLLLLLFKDYEHTSSIILVRLSVPYLITYFIVTISSGVLKDRYEKNQKRLVELVELLNHKNAKISDQHSKLEKSYKSLADLNANLEETVKLKTFRIEEKNVQLAELAWANAHRVRAPLARILGLLHLIEVDPSEKECYIKWIDNEAKALDEIIRIVGHSIEENINKA